MSRPQTSKPRGLCKYYTTERGCFNRSKCKFLHGPDQSLTPFDQAKACKFFAAGFCRRGDECWFRHVAATGSTSRGEDEGSDDVCNVCLEKPVTYGLLTGCGHVFCISCIRQWRNANDKSSDMSAVVKKCPLCRASSTYVIPSSASYPHNHPDKLAAIDKYKASMARTPCVHFQHSPPCNRMCPFGRDCFYAHANADSTPYVFPHGVEHYIGRYRARVLTGQRVRSRLVEGGDALGLGLEDGDGYTSALIFQRLMEGAPFDDVQGTIETMRANLPGMLSDFGMNLAEDGGSDDEGEGGDGAHYTDVSRPGGGPVHGSAEVLARLAEVMLETINDMRDRIGIPSDAQTFDDPAADDADDLPPLEPISPSSSSTLSFEPSPLEPVPASSRFSTSVGPQRLYIDITEDEEESDEDADEDDEEESLPALEPLSADVPAVESTPEAPAIDHDTAVPNSPASSPSPVVPAVTVSALPTALPAASLPPADAAPTPPLEHNAEPPFLTDGRGRVVWSSTAARPSARREPVSTSTPTPTSPAAAGDSLSREPSRVAKPRRVAAARESALEPTLPASVESPPAFTTDGRGRVIWTASSLPASPPVEAESEATGEGGAGDYSDGGGRSLLGRAYDAVFL